MLEISYYSKIIDQNNKIIKENKTKPPIKILSPSTTTIMTSMMEDVIIKGTGTRVRSSGYKDFAAGKTGTSQNFKDAWFVGFNDRYTSAVWLGYDRSVLSLGPGQTGGNIAAPIWGEYQVKLSQIRKKNSELNPESEASYLITGETSKAMICPNTGKRTNSDCLCSGSYSEMFISGTIPDGSCESFLEHGNTSTTNTSTNYKYTPPPVSVHNNPTNNEEFFKGDDF